MNKNKAMLTFTATGRGRGVYTKLRLINDIKSYVTYLIANSKSEIYFFSNIEIGSELSNPHLHTQIWCDDFEAIQKIYDAVLAKFSLVKKICRLTSPKTLCPEFMSGPTDAMSGVINTMSGPIDTMSGPQQNHKFYNYVIKDYSKDLNDNELWNLEQTKKRMRKTLGLKLRFYSRSKSKYTSKLYRMVYRSYKVLRAFADTFIDFMLSHFFVKKSQREELLALKKHSKSFSISSFIIIKNKGRCEVNVESYFFSFVFEILFFAPSMSPPFFSLVAALCIGVVTYGFIGTYFILEVCYDCFTVVSSLFHRCLEKCWLL